MKRYDFIFYTGFVVIIGLLAWKIGNLKKINAQLLQSNQKLNFYKRVFDLQSSFLGKKVPAFSLPYVDGKGEFNFLTEERGTYYLLIALLQR